MKCPKCGYLGFETGDRCKHCGYDFSLLTSVPAGAPPDADLNIRSDDGDDGAGEVWLDRFDRSMDEASKPKEEHLAGVPERPETQAPGSGLPLFKPEPDDIPLIVVPSAPRAPLAVRRTPETPRLRAVPRSARAGEPALQLFTEESQLAEPGSEPPEPARPLVRARRREGSRRIGGRRFLAGLVDHVMLLAIDLMVVYFTLRIAGLTTADVAMLPVVPFMAFIGLLKLTYFSAFTALGGQTIGKMAMGIRVVGERGPIDGGVAVRRTLATLLSLLPFGLGLLPAFFGDRRALHDRLTHTRVVRLPSA